MNYLELMLAQVAIMTALFDAAQAESRDFTDEEQTKYTAAETEHKRLKAAKETADKLAAMTAGAQPVAAVTDPAAAAAAEAARIAALTPAANSGAAANNVVVGNNLVTDKPYANLGLMLVDVASSKNGQGGEAMDRLVKASLNTETGADGGFLIPPDFIGTMLEQADAESQLYSRAMQLDLQGNSANIPAVDETSRADGSRWGGIQVFWAREGQEGQYKQTKFRNLDLKLGKLLGFVSVTSEMLEDSTLLASWVQNAFPAEMAFVIDQAFYDGDGKGIPLGFMNSGALVSVPKETSQTAATVVYENVIKMWARMPARRIMNAAWFVTQQVLEQLPLMKIDVGTGGGPVFIPPGGASASPYATLLGRPIIPIEQAAALGTVGDIVLADLSDYIAIQKGGLDTATSIHVDFDRDKTAFRFRRRINGAPYTRKALQSRAKSTFYTSPYIALATRA